MYLITDIQTYIFKNAIDYWFFIALSSSEIFISTAAHIFTVRNLKYLPEVETFRFAS